MQPFYPPRSSSHQPGSTPHPWLQEPPRMLWSTCNPPADHDGSGCWQEWREPLNHCSRGKGAHKYKLRTCIFLEHSLTCWIRYFGHLARWPKDAPMRHECPLPKTIWAHTLTVVLLLCTHTAEIELALWSSSDQGANPITRTPPSWPHLNLLASQRPYLQIPSHWGFGFRIRFGGEHTESIAFIYFFIL